MPLALLSGFIGGIAFSSFVLVNIWIVVALFVGALIVFLYKYFVPPESRPQLILISLFLASFLLGVSRMVVSDLYSESDLEPFVGHKVEAEGVIVGEPDVRENNTKLTIKLSHVYPSHGEVVPVSEKILVTVPVYPEFSYGDKVRVGVSLVEPAEIESEGRTFDYRGYLRVRGIWYTSRFTSVELISSGHGSPVKNLLFKTKHLFTDSMKSVLPEPESSLLSGLLLGSKQSLGKDLLTEFQRTGVSHIVVLSGYNIAIVAESIMSLLKFLPKAFSLGIGALSIVLFTVLSGGGASAWRAAIMVLVAIFAKRMGRDYKAARVLGFTVVIMLVPNPLLLAFDPSFQLSILATIGLVFVSPVLTPYFPRVPERFGLREIVSTTVATQIAVLPYLLYNMGLLSLVALPVNVLILGTIPLTMLLGFLTGLAGLVSLYLSFIPGFFTYILLWYQLTVVHIGSSLPFGVVSLPAFSPILLIFFYTVIFYGLFSLRAKDLKKKR